MPIPIERARRLLPDGEDALIRRIEALERYVMAQNTASATSWSLSASASGLSSIPTSWTTFPGGAAAEAVLPSGFPVGTFTVFASVGDTLSASTSTLSVQIVYRAKYADGAYSSWYALSDTYASPDSRVLVANAFGVINFNLNAATPDPVHGRPVAVGLGVNAARVGGTEVANTGNWHIAAVVNASRT